MSFLQKLNFKHAYKIFFSISLSEFYSYLFVNCSVMLLASKYVVISFSTALQMLFNYG